MIQERQNRILSYIMEKGDVSLNELFDLYPDVSSMTIRRDLDLLEKNAHIQRYRGGARPLSSQAMIKEPAYIQRAAERAQSKQIIADKATLIANEARSIYIDSGTTCVQLASNLPDNNIFVLTPAPYVAIALANNHNVRVNLTGGQLNRDTFALSGNNAKSYTKTINIDIAFIGASACSLKNGFTCGDYQEAELKKLIIRKAQKVVCLMDVSKLNYSMPYTFATAKNIDVLITDKPLPESYYRMMKKAKVQLI